MKKLLNFMSKMMLCVWKTITFTRQLLLNLLFIGMVVGIYYIFSIEQALTNTVPKIPKDKQALLVNLSGPIVEKRQRIAPYDFATQSLFGQPLKIENSLFEIVEKIRAAAKDKNINGMVLNLNELPETSLTKLRYIAKSIEEFKATGKEVVAVGGHYNQSQYYLSSYADEILMSPDGVVLLPGYGSYNLYLKDLLDKWKINTHVFRVGTYKSFVEPYTRADMSEAAREASSVWLNQLWNAYVSDVSINRGTPVDVFSPTAQTYLTELTALKGDFAQLSVKMGLVNTLLTRPQIRMKLAEKFGTDGEDSFEYVSIYDYSPKDLTLPQKDQIAVIVASGTIIDGPEMDGTIGGDTLASMLRKARLNDAIKAVVLRIDSPGGSAFASEVIRIEVEALKNAEKPIVVSMSSLAASGGYWIASSANRIIAQPTTITGSIGVFGILTTFEETLADVGIYSDGVGTTPFSGIGVTRAFPEKMSEIMQLGVENSYQRFIELISTQRGLSIEDVDKVAQGRVWTGLDAMNHGLVDQMGDFDDAITSAAQLAKIDAYSLNWMKEPMTATQQFFNDILQEVMVTLNIQSTNPLNSTSTFLTNTVLKEVKHFNNFNDPNGQYALCSSCNYYD